MTNSILQYVQINQDVALIDSRVYCRDIINVIHKDWMSDTLGKYQSQIEQRFGAIRFETASNYREDGSYNPKPEKYALLTKPQCDACLVLSKNLAETVGKKLDLVADFEFAEQQLKAMLERQLLGSGSSQVEALQLEIVQLKERVEYVTAKALYWERKAFTVDLSEDLKDHDTQFKYDAKRLWLITGLADYKYLTRCIERDYRFGVDFIKKGWTNDEHKSGMSEGRYKFLLTSDAAISIVTSHRSRAGCLKSAVPEEYHFLFDIPLDDSENKQNRRRLQSR